MKKKYFPGFALKYKKIIRLDFNNFILSGPDATDNNCLNDQVNQSIILSFPDVRNSLNNLIHEVSDSVII